MKRDLEFVNTVQEGSEETHSQVFTGPNIFLFLVSKSKMVLMITIFR